MKRILALLLSLATLVSCFLGGGCNSGLTEEQKKNALIIEYYKAGYGELWIQNLAAEFTRKTGQEVVLLSRSGDQGVDSMSTSLHSGTSHTDLYFTKKPSFAELYKGQAVVAGKRYDTWYADLTDVYDYTIEGENIKVKDKMFDAFEEYYKMPVEDKYYDNKYYFFPWVTGMMGIVMNMDVWAALDLDMDLPRTTNEFFEVCKAVNEKVNADKTDDLDMAPFIYGHKEEYFTAYFQVFMNQYEGNARMDKFYQGWSSNQEDRYDTNMISYTGLERALEFFEELLKKEDNKFVYVHSNSVDMNAMQMQGAFMNNAALFSINGDWLEREMITKYPNANIEMIKTPVISSIVEKLSFYTEGEYTSFYSLDETKKAEYDDKLQAIINYVDGVTEQKPAGCSDDDIAIVREARAVEYVSGNALIAQVPCYSNQIDKAKEFLKFMASDEGMKIFRDGTSGCELPFNYTVKEENTNVTVFRKSINKVLDVSVARFVNDKDRIFSIGGVNVLLYNNNIGRFVDAFISSKNKKTAKQYFDAEVIAVNDLLKTANI